MIDVDSKAVSNLIGSIYESTYDPARLQAVVENVQKLFDGSKACFARIGPDLQRNDTVATESDPVFYQLYIEDHADQHNVLGEAVQAVPVGAVYSDHALVGSDKLRSSRFWNEWMAPQDMYGGLACKVQESGPSFWFVDVQRGRRQEAFGARHAELMETIAPHLARAVEISRKFRLAHDFASTFSYLPFGVILVDGYMRIASSNAAAEAILLRPGSGLSRKAGHLTVADARTMTALQLLVAQACNIQNDVFPGVGGDLLIRKPRNGKGPDLALSVGPLVSSFQEFPFMGRHAAIFIREISLDLPPGFQDQMRALFGLSPKEADLAARLAAGQTLKQAAHDAEIQFSTARSYLEKIFQKTETRQQSQLVALLKSAQTIARTSEK